MRKVTRSQKIKKFKYSKVLLPVLGFIVTAVLFITVTYAVINHFTTNIVTSYLDEMVIHDKAHIKDYVSDRFKIMKMICDGLDIRPMGSIDDVLRELQVQADVYNVERFCILDEDGNLYSSDYTVMSNDDNPFTDYFKIRKEEFFMRYEETDNSGNTREYMLYGFGFYDNPLHFIENGPGFVGVIMLRDISFIREKMRISSFGGRGYTSIVDATGTFVVTDESMGAGDKPLNSFSLLSGKKIEKYSVDDIKEKFYRHETFTFWYTDEHGVRKFILFSPAEDTGWTFITSIEESVYSDQIQQFVELIALVMGGLFIIFMVVSGLYRYSRKKLNAFYSSVASGVRSRQYYDDKVIDAPVNALAIVDIDHLKWINDSYGHLVGDEAIREMAKVLVKKAGSFGEVCRFGGDEFVIAFQREIMPDEFVSIVNLIVEEVREIRLEDHPEFSMTLSIGAYYGNGTAGEMFANADELLYEAKKTRNRAIIRSPR